ncbi:MAG: YitT family protein [Metamycoplasmataceae bacterium]
MKPQQSGNPSTNTEEIESRLSIFAIFLKDWKKIAFLFLAAFFHAFGTVIFLVQANIVPSGVSSISQTLLYFFSNLRPYVTLIYFALNVPLILFFWKKIKKQFIFLSLLFMLFNAFWGFILGEYGKPISSIFVIIKDWDINLIDTPNYSTWPIFVYVCLGLLINSIAASAAWKLGASTGGTDIVAYYFSTKSKKNVGNFLWMISISLSFGAIIALFVGGKYEAFFGIRTICSVFYILLSSYIINNLYPKYKKVLVRVDSKKYQELAVELNQNYCHAFKIKENVSGYTQQKNYTIETVMLLLEYKDFKKQILAIDESAWITRMSIEDLSGNFDYSNVE